MTPGEKVIDIRSQIMFLKGDLNGAWNEYGYWIRQKRTQQNLSLRELASEFGISAPYLSDSDGLMEKLAKKFL